MRPTFDAAVIGAGVFGAWIAWHLSQVGLKVILLDAYGVAHSRASSGGETRIIRMGYGGDELYTRWSQQSLPQWKQMFAAQAEALFIQTGVLWLASKQDARFQQTATTLKRCNIPFERLDRAELQNHYPQIALGQLTEGILETESGVLLARRAVNRVVTEAVKNGVEYRVAQVIGPRGSEGVDAIQSTNGLAISAGDYIFACGAWLGKVFPDVLASRIFPTRQEVFFFGVPPGDLRFAPPRLPTWLIQDEEYYGMPDLEGRGFKVALDRHGERVDPDTQSRVVSPQACANARKYLAQRFPDLADAPIIETRVCQYENTSSGDFLIDRHPELNNVWFAGGGSGHGFKHGPEVGRYVASQIRNTAPPEPRFLFAAQTTEQHRTVY